MAGVHGDGGVAGRGGEHSDGLHHLRGGVLLVRGQFHGLQPVSGQPQRVCPCALLALRGLSAWMLE